jgi:hypothetical protein
MKKLNNIQFIKLLTTQVGLTTQLREAEVNESSSSSSQVQLTLTSQQSDAAPKTTAVLPPPLKEMDPQPLIKQNTHKLNDDLLNPTLTLLILIAWLVGLFLVIFVGALVATKTRSVNQVVQHVFFLVGWQ